MRNPRVLLAIGISAAVAGIGVSLGLASARDYCEGHIVRTATVVPLAVAGVIVIGTFTPYLIARNQDVYGHRKPMQLQLGRIVLAFTIAAIVVGLGLIMLALLEPASCES